MLCITLYVPRVVDSLNPSVAPAVENLMVVANLFLQPPLAYVMPRALLQVGKIIRIESFCILFYPNYPLFTSVDLN